MSELRAYRGDTRRRVVRGAGPIAPWHATVKIVALELRRGTSFEVVTSWTGPPAAGFPPSDRPVEGSDTYVTDTLALAREIATRAEDAFRAPEVPDLRAIAAAAKTRANDPE